MTKENLIGRIAYKYLISHSLLNTFIGEVYAHYAMMTMEKSKTYYYNQIIKNIELKANFIPLLARNRLIFFPFALSKQGHKFWKHHDDKIYETYLKYIEKLYDNQGSKKGNYILNV